MWRRAVATSSTATPIRELKKHIHRLYKHIHPDRLARYPQQRLINESSFQVLQSALDRHIHIYMHSPSSADVPPAASITSITDDTTHLTFFARTATGDGLAKAVVAFQKRRLAHVLHDLFDALGLDPPPRHILSPLSPTPNAEKSTPSSRSSASPSSSAASSRTRLSELVEAARQTRPTRADMFSSRRGDVHVSVTAMRRAYGVRVLVHDGLPPSTRQTALARLEILLHSLSHHDGIDIRSATLALHGGSATTVRTTHDTSRDDSNSAPPYSGESGQRRLCWTPRVELGICARDGAWRHVLSSSELTHACREATYRRDSLSDSEALAATRLGVRIVLCGSSEDDVDDTFIDRYAAVVHSVASTIRPSSKGRVGDGGDAGGHDGRAGLAVMVCKGDGVDVDTVEGVVSIGVSRGEAGLEAALDDVVSRGVGRSYAVLRTRMEAEHRLLVETRRALRVGHLTRAEGIVDGEWRAALRRLRAESGRLRDVLPGMSVVVGRTARVLDGNVVEIPHDFHKWIEW